MKTFQYFKLQVVAQLQGLENNLRHRRVLEERQQHPYTGRHKYLSDRRYNTQGSLLPLCSEVYCTFSEVIHLHAPGNRGSALHTLHHFVSAHPHCHICNDNTSPFQKWQEKKTPHAEEFHWVGLTKKLYKQLVNSFTAQLQWGSLKKTPKSIKILVLHKNLDMHEYQGKPFPWLQIFTIIHARAVKHS